MRVSCPAGGSPPLLRPPAHSCFEGIGKATSSLHKNQPKQTHTDCLKGLYQMSKSRNHRLLQLSLDLSRDINFLKEYCRQLELELERKGFYQQKRIQKLSRKETAASIFQSYSDTSSLLEDWRQEGEAQLELSRLRNQNFNLSNQNKQLHSKVITTQPPLRLHRAVQVDNYDFLQLKQNFQQAQDRIGALNIQLFELKKEKGKLQIEQRKKEAQNGIYQTSKQVFGKIYQVMRDYKSRMKALAHEKRDIEKKYRLLSENIRITETGGHLKLVELLNEKIEILSKLVEKQQGELENTISIYQKQLSKIEERRREQLQFFENQRIGLENQNIKLCIDVQKALNRQDSHHLLLLQEKNTTERLAKEVVKLTKDVNSLENKERQIKSTKFKIQSGVLKFYGDRFKSIKMDDSQAKNSYHSAGYQFSRDQNENQSNFQYQFSEMSESRPEEHYPEMHRRRQERDDSGYKGVDRIKITYNSYLGSGFRSQARFHDSAVQFKRRLVESKPDIISNKR